MFNVEFKHSETKAWTQKATFESSQEAEKFAYIQSLNYTNAYRVVTDNGFVTAEYKSKF
jgi:hypothetical protein